MTDTPDAAGTEPAAFELPQRATLDPTSAVALAIGDKLGPMLEGPDGAMAINMRTLAEAALDALGDIPRIPEWIGPRSLGGAVRDGNPPEPEVRVDVNGATITLRTTMRVERGDAVQEGTVAPADLRLWALSALAAAGIAEAAGPYFEIDPDLIPSETPR